ncbi:MAG: TRAP transporter large permease subunit [Alphaproteobacteria bacterium]|nr:MAG: TRAP transporter large permease subunit [Alphaproteobacteria bacterium]
MAEHLDLLLFAVACLLLLRGFPVALTLGGTALIFALIGNVLGVFDVAYLVALPQRIFGTMTNEVLIAVPLFIFMGSMLERSKVAEELLSAMGLLFGKLHGGLGISVCVVGALLAASTGIVGATVVTMGLLSLPTMLHQGYNKRLATGVIAASGTLGQIIPPSIVLILLGDVISSAYQKAQLDQGVLSPDTVSVGDMFAGALVPGLILVGLYIIYVALFAFFSPKSAPAVSRNEDQATRDLMRDIARALVPPLGLIIAVLGSILGGIATPTEAAAVGAIGAILLAGARLDHASKSLWTGNIAITLTTLSLIALLGLSQTTDLRLGLEDATLHPAHYVAFVLIGITVWGLGLSLWRIDRNGILKDVVHSTTRITAMVFVILIGAALFSLVFRGLGGDDKVHALLTNLPGGIFGAVLVVMLIMFLLGFFLDFIEITFVVVPIVAPILLMMGLDPIWLGIMMAINLQTSFLTPPFGFALFYLRGVAPPEIRTSEIYRGAIPFVLIQIVMLILLALYPGIATWLPSQIFN